MLKKLIAGAFICLLGVTYAQTDELNAKKYWKFRNNFRRDFVKIGRERGEGIPIASRLPIGCKNNVDATGNKGLVRWADGMIFQGHYIGFLATEYRLLKNRGQDVTATLNELYYALNAINRADRLAEFLISDIDENGLPVVKGEDLNGFYLRDDAGEYTYANWENGAINCRCGEGSAYTKNNMAGINSGGDISRAKSDDHSTPSLDQMTSLLVGIVMINKLLDDGVYVQPTLEDPVMEIKTEAKAIANRLISYAWNHNYYLLDEWGWPVGNGGGELIVTSYPISVIGNNLLGNDYSLTMKRRIFAYNKAQPYYSTLDTDVRDDLWAEYGYGSPGRAQINRFTSINPWIYELPGLSNFEAYQADGDAHLISTSFSEPFWHSLIPDEFPTYADDWSDNYRFDDTFGFPFSLFCFDEINLFADYNFTIMFNLGVASGIFNGDQVSDWGDETNNYQLVLIDAILNDREPAYGGKTFYETLLNSMPVYGGFKFSGQSWDPNPVIAASLPKQIIWSSGWGGEYKWNDPLESNSADGHEGQFNALDYMYLHNLYYLVYGDEIAEPYEESYDCFCGSIEKGDIYAAQADSDDDIGNDHMPLEQALDEGIPLHSALVKQLAILDFCTENVFGGAASGSTINIKQLFDDYHDMGISLNKFQTETFTILDGGKVNIESRFIICNTKELTVDEGGEINLDKGEIIIKPGAKLIIEGDVNIEVGTKVIVENEGKIIVKSGGVLNNEGYIQLKEGALLEYEEGATLKMTDDAAEIHFDGGDLVLKENADFTFEIGESGSGQLRFSELGDHIIAEENTSFLIGGNDTEDPIIVIEKDADFFCDSENLKWVSIHDGKVILQENARFVSVQDFTANEVHFESLEQNRGLVLFDETNIIKSTYDNVHIEALLFYKNSGTFNMTFSDMNMDTVDFMILVNGMGYSISESDFNGSAQYMLKAKNTTEFSLLSQCAFNGNHTSVGVIDNSFSELTVQGCAFNSLYAGVHKPDGKLNLKCNQFNDFVLSGAIAQNNCVMDLSSNALGGYNTFDKNSPVSGHNLTLWNAQNLLLSNGYNTFDDIGNLPIINGTLQYAVPPPLASIVFAQRNKWNPLNSIPPSTDFTVTSSITGLDINFHTSPPQAGNCPISDDLDSDVGTYSPLQGHDSVMVNTAHFQNVPLSTALDLCNEATKRFDEGNSDITALHLFEEVLSTYPEMDASAEADWLVRLGSQYMKHTLRYAFYTGQITKQENSASFHEGVQSYVNVLNAITSIPLTQNNYQQLFYWEMDKAQLLHFLGKHDLALWTIANAESCGLDSTEQAYVNHWKFELNQEFRKREYGFMAEEKDTNWVDTTYYHQPVSQNFGHFGSTIINAQTIDFYNCANTRSPLVDKNKVVENEDTNFEFSVFPNPNSGIFNVTYNLPENSTGIVAIYDLEGREVYRFVCQTGNHWEVVDLKTLGQGAYLYSYVVNQVKTHSGRFIIH